MFAREEDVKGKVVVGSFDDLSIEYPSLGTSVTLSRLA